MKNLEKHENRIEQLLAFIGAVLFYLTLKHNLHFVNDLLPVAIETAGIANQSRLTMSPLLLILGMPKNPKFKSRFKTLCLLNVACCILLTISYNYLHQVNFYVGLELVCLELVVLYFEHHPIQKIKQLLRIF
jgi:hypothetical protein